MYTLSLINGKEYEINESEMKAVTLKTDSGGSVYLKRLNLTLNVSSVSVIEPIGLSSRDVDRTKQFEGVTPNGDLMVKKFGRWYLAHPLNGEEEVAVTGFESGLLPTPEEYEKKFKHIPSGEWLNLLAGGDSERPQHQISERSGEFSKISSPAPSPVSS